jgi:lauroyl/myristoyl acyltransferase
MRVAQKVVVYGGGVLKLGLLEILEGMRILPLGLRYRLAELCFVVIFVVVPSKRRGARYNLSLVLGRRPSMGEVVRLFLDYGRYWAESAALQSFWDKTCHTFVGDPLPRADEQFIGLTLHVGNFELFGPALHSVRDKPFAVVAEALRPAFLARHFANKRRRYHIRTIPHDRPRQIVAALRRGESLGVVCDRAIGGEGRRVGMLGVTLTLPLSLVDYALNHGIAIVIAYCVRDARGVTVVCRRLPRALSHDRVLTEITTAFEEILKRYPYQWHALMAVS